MEQKKYKSYFTWWTTLNDDNFEIMAKYRSGYIYLLTCIVDDIAVLPSLLLHGFNIIFPNMFIV